MAENKLIVLIGPTAVGKTKMSIDIAKRFGLEVISGDSMQIYKDMDILTGKIEHTDGEGVNHHMIDIKAPDESFSVSDFKQQVEGIIEKTYKADKIPFIVGGTGHYIRALIYDYDFNDENDEEKRRLTEKFERLSTTILYAQLKEISETEAEGVHRNNRQRIIRLLVKHELSDHISNRDTNYTAEPKYDTLIIGLTTSREVLYERINKRVESMFDEGLIDEVNHLASTYKMSKTASGAIGYKEFLPYFSGEITLDEVREKIQQNTRQYAKRQLTFFRNQLDVKWFDIEKSAAEEVMATIEAFIS